MSGTVGTQTSTTPAATAAGSGQSAQSALGSLTNNYQTFLKMLTTQLQNQDPTSPMDSSQFTTELVQFSGVEQQIQTNASLSTLIQLTQGESVVQSSQIVGKQVQVTSAQLALQQGNAAIRYTAPSSGPVTISVSNSTGQQIASANVAAAQGSNTWTWNGQTSAGAQEPDGAYTVSVLANQAGGTTSPLPFTVTGTATSVQQNGANVQLQLGGLSVNMSAVVSVGG